MTKNTAALIGFFIAPAAVPLVLFVMDQVTVPVLRQIDLWLYIGFGFIAYLFAAMFTFFIAVPLFFLLRRLNLICWWSSVAAGLIVGGIAAATLRSPNPLTVDDFVRMVPAGGISAFVFWLIWRLGRDPEI